MPTPTSVKALRAFSLIVVVAFPLALIVSVLWTSLDGPAYMEARRECSYYDTAYFVTDTCHVDWWERSISITMNASPAEIEAYCTKGNNLFSYILADRWVLKISTPYTAGVPIARCRFTSKYVVGN